MRTCKAPSCDRKHHALGWCSLHYDHARKWLEQGPGTLLGPHVDGPKKVEFPPLEREEQKAVVDLFRGAGFKVRTTSQKREARVAPGIADLMAHHRGRKLFLWFEVKAYRPNGYPARQVPRSLEPDQVAFREDAIACGQRHEWGGRNEARAYLESVGILQKAAA